MNQCILRAIKIVMEEEKRPALRNVCIFMDNAPTNKCYGLLGPMCALTLLGIARKVKIKFMLVGHGHVDNDGDIGKMYMHIYYNNIP